MRIIQFCEKYKGEVSLLIEEISQEFDKPITSSNANAKSTIDQQWLAIEDDLLIGIIGIIKLEGHNAILKSMFVRKGFRGKVKGVSFSLLQTVIDWAIKEEIERLYLGTMSQFRAAQKFYAKNGFYQIDHTALPSDFINNPLDDLYYRKRLL